MDESKIEITHRLQRDGRWAEASKFKDQAISKARSEGMKREEARRAGWEAMAEKYPLLSNPLKPLQTIPDNPKQDEDLRALTESSFSEIHNDVLWAYNNFEVSDVVASEAPSRGAWGLLIWGRENRDKFFSQMVVKVIAVAEKKLDEVEEEDKETQAIASLELLFDQ